MDKIRIGNDIHIEWLIFRNNQPEVFEGKDVEVRLMHTRTRDVMPLDWVISEGVVSATFYGKDQINTGDYKLMLVENNGAPNMATIDECKAFTLVQCSCQERKEEPSTSLQLHKVQLASSFALSGGGNINVEGYPNVDELEEVKELSGNENIIITDSEGNKKTTISNLKEYVVKDISELPPFRIFETESDYNAVKDELGDCVVCLRDTGVMLYHVKKVEDEGEGEDKYIRFADPEVQRILVENFSADKVGMTSEDIEKVTDIGTKFRGNTAIETFDEFERFTGIEILGNTQYETVYYSPFYQCVNIKSIKFSNNLKVIRANAFNGCSKLNIESLPPSLISIRNDAFIGCNLDGLVINTPSLTMLGNNSFAKTNIARVENLGSIESTGITSGNVEDNGAFRDCAKLIFARLPNTLNDTGISLFYRCVALEECVMPSSIKHIRAYAFNGCSSLVKCNIPESLTSIDGEAFSGCTSLEIEDLQLPNLETLGQNAFYGVKIKKISNLGKITALPTASTSTQNFGDKSVLEEVVLPIGITNIGAYAFMNYTLLTGDFNLLSVTTIGGSAFQNTAITSIMLPLVNTISWNAFTDCKKLKFVKIGDSIGKIDAAAFQNCISLENVIIGNATPPTLSGTSFTNTNNCLIYVPDASVEAYKTATNWSTYASRIKGISELPIDNPTLYDEIKDYLG